MKDSKQSLENHVYQASITYVAVFYILLLAWTFVCVFLIGFKAAQWWANLTKLFMIAFILVYTWYFSVAISYKIEVRHDGAIRLTSFRRIIETGADEIAMVEGPHFPIGFIRLRLAREKAYMFCVTKDPGIRKILAVIRAANPDVKFKGL